MPLVNWILCFLNHALLSSWWFLLLKFILYVPKMPRWFEPMLSLIRVNPKDSMGYTYLVFHQVKLSTLMPLSKWEVNVRLCLGEVESTLNLCVHAHGPDVDPIMEASCNNNYLFDIISLGIGELIVCNRCSYHDCSCLTPFLGQVKALFFC